MNRLVVGPGFSDTGAAKEKAFRLISMILTEEGQEKIHFLLVSAAPCVCLAALTPHVLPPVDHSRGLGL